MMTQRLIEIVKTAVKNATATTKHVIQPEFQNATSGDAYFRTMLINEISGKIRALSHEEIAELQEALNAEGKK